MKRHYTRLIRKHTLIALGVMFLTTYGVYGLCMAVVSDSTMNCSDSLGNCYTYAVYSPPKDDCFGPSLNTCADDDPAWGTITYYTDGSCGGFGDCTGGSPDTPTPSPISKKKPGVRCE